MKTRIILIITLAIFFCPKGFAQAPGGFFGIEYLPTFAKFDVKNVSGGVYKTTAVLGTGFGAQLGFNVTNHFGLQGEVLYSAIAQKFNDEENIEHRVELSYLNVPLLIALNTNVSVPVNLNVVIGPQIGINTGSKIEGEGSGGIDTFQAVLAVKPADLGFAYGAGLDFNLSKALALGIGFRGVYGLIDISDQSKSITTDQYYLLDRSHVKTYSGYVGLKFKW